MKVNAVIQTGQTEELLETQRQIEHAINNGQEIMVFERYFPAHNSQAIGRIISCSVANEKLTAVFEIDDATFEDFTNRLNIDTYGKFK